MLPLEFWKLAPWNAHLAHSKRELTKKLTETYCEKTYHINLCWSNPYSAYSPMQKKHAVSFKTSLPVFLQYRVCCRDNKWCNKWGNKFINIWNLIIKNKWKVQVDKIFEKLLDSARACAFQRVCFNNYILAVVGCPSKLQAQLVYFIQTARLPCKWLPSSYAILF